MIAPHSQGTIPAQTSTKKPARRIGGVAVMLLGCALVAWGTHFLARTGNCSSTGYVSYGPVPKCGGGEALYIISTFFLGPLVILIGWGMASIDSLLWPMFCVCMGIGLATISLDHTAAPGARAFALLSGIGCGALALLSVVITVHKRLRRANH